MPESPLDAFLLVVLPYLAIAVLAVGSALRFRSARFTVSAMSSQVLENRRLLWGSVPFHAGILLIVAGHLVPLAAPSLWRSVVARPAVLLAVEAAGVAAALLTAVGLALLIARRLGSARLRAVTTPMDLAVAALLAVQVVLGLAVALTERWGAAWSTVTLAPYLASLVRMSPRPELAASLPPLVKAHLAAGWVLLAILPFSRLVHLFTAPLGYLARPPQRVVWASARQARPVR
jgi:nitrate reductase gamma subunit